MAEYKHGGTGTRLYSIFLNMKQRCYNPSTPKYHNYGGRGITICPEWLSDFGLFKNWSIENGYAENLTIDRIDNDKNYSPFNCRWITNSDQQLNKRTNRKVSFNGESKTLSEWAREKGIETKTLESRLNTGWEIGSALNTSPIPKIKDLKGKVFGRLTVINLASIGSHGANWMCICECGTIKCVRGSNMTDGRVKSCGCLQRETASLTGKNTKHEKAIIKYDLHGNYITEYKSPIDAHAKTGISKSCIISVANKAEYKPGKIRSQAGGYVWRYKEGKICI